MPAARLHRRGARAGQARQPARRLPAGPGFSRPTPRLIRAGPIEHLPDSPALDRLAFLLDGLAGAPDWQPDAVFEPEFLHAIAPIDYAELTRQRAAQLAPLTLVGLDVRVDTARARLLHPDGSRQVLTCVVDPAPPHRISRTWLQPEVPTDLTPRLAPDRVATTAGQRVIVVAGLPGSGKSTLADALGRQLGQPVFAIDWLLGALTPFGGRHLDDPLGLGYEQLITLAFRQLSLGQSAVLDGPFEDTGTRDRLVALAGPALRVITCHCSDEAAHRTRLASRTRDIPGWHEGGDWADVQRRTERYPPWPAAHRIDTAQPADQVLAEALAYLAIDDGSRPA